VFCPAAEVEPASLIARLRLCGKRFPEHGPLSSLRVVSPRAYPLFPPFLAVKCILSAFLIAALPFAVFCFWLPCLRCNPPHCSSGVASKLSISGVSPLFSLHFYPPLLISMGFPQALVDKVIDCIGQPYVKTNPPYAFFRRERCNGEGHQVDLLSWAQVSKAYNCRVRSYLFSHCRVIGIDPLGTLKQHPHDLLEHTRILEILHLSDSEALNAIVCRFNSAPVVHVTLSSVPISVGLPATLRSALGSVTSVSLVGCSYNPVALKKFFGSFGCVNEVHLRNCQTGHPLNGAGHVLPELPALERHSWTTDPRKVLQQVVLPVRTLHIESLADRAEDRLIRAWSDSLEHLEVKMSNTWGA